MQVKALEALKARLKSSAPLQASQMAYVQTAFTLLCLFLGLARNCRADVFVLISEPYGKYGRINPTGHSLIGFDRLCAEGQTKLRPCRAGEMGSVVSRYHAIDKYDWLAMPLLPYLYGVKSAAEVPPFASKELVKQIRDAYRREYLEAIAPDNPDGSTPDGNWTELVGSAYDRSIHVFRLATTAAQDETLMHWINDRPNKTQYNLATNNCADFVRELLSQVYPGMVKRRTFPDMRVTTPRLVAQSLTRYAKQHPEIKVEAWTIKQVPGEKGRSHRIRGLSDGLLTSGYAVPFLFVAPVAVEAVAVDFLWRGRSPLYPKHAPVLDAEGTVKEITEPPLEDRPATTATLTTAAATNPTAPNLTVTNSTITTTTTQKEAPAGKVAPKPVNTISNTPSDTPQTTPPTNQTSATSDTKTGAR